MPTEDGLAFYFIAEADKLVLEQDFEKDEIVKALKEMRGDKAPRMNGYYYGIFQHCWWVVKGDVMAFFKEFHDTRKFEKYLNVFSQRGLILFFFISNKSLLNQKVASYKKKGNEISLSNYTAQSSLTRKKKDLIEEP